MSQLIVRCGLRATDVRFSKAFHGVEQDKARVKKDACCTRAIVEALQVRVGDQISATN
jgi:hypothetical protein